MTRDKRKHVFEKDVLRKIARALQREKHSMLLLPMNVFIDLNVGDQVYIDDELAAEVLRELEGFEKAYQYRNGRMWLPMSLSAELMGRYRTALQMVFLI